MGKAVAYSHSMNPPNVQMIMLFLLVFETEIVFEKPYIDFILYFR